MDVRVNHKECWGPEDWCFWTVCWRRHLRGPWTARRSNQSILKEISPEYSLRGLKPNLQHFGHLMGRDYPLGKTLMLWKIESRRRRGWQRIRLDGITDSMDMSLRKLREIVKGREAWYAAIHGITKSWMQLSNWTTTFHSHLYFYNKFTGASCITLFLKIRNNLKVHQLGMSWIRYQCDAVKLLTEDRLHSKVSSEARLQYCVCVCCCCLAA